MNYVKTSIPKEEYKDIYKIGDKYILHILPVDVDNDMVLCVETMLDHNPTKTEIAEITTDATAYFAELELKAEISNIKAEIAELKQKLADTDYNAIKYAEGWIDSEEYAPIKAERQAWRDKINELELLI